MHAQRIAVDFLVRYGNGPTAEHVFVAINEAIRHSYLAIVKGFGGRQ